MFGFSSHCCDSLKEFFQERKVLSLPHIRFRETVHHRLKNITV